METTNKQKCIIYGASGHGTVIMESLLWDNKYDFIGFYDDNPALEDKQIQSYPIHNKLNFDHSVNVIIGIGDNKIRGRMFDRIKSLGFSFATVIHPKSIVSHSANISEGSCVMAGAIINANSIVQTNAIINTGSSVDHDCLIKNHAQIAPGAILCGNCTIGEYSFICAGATIGPNVNIGNNVVVGAGAVVLNDVSDNQFIVGIPGREKKL